MTFFNTTIESGQTLIEFREKAKTQNERILEVFKANPGINYGASDFSKIFPSMVLTSIRRAINTLKENGEIVDTGEKQKGIYSRNEYTYRLKQ